MPILAPCDKPLLPLDGAAAAGMVMPPGLKFVSPTLFTEKPEEQQSHSITNHPAISHITSDVAQGSTSCKRQAYLSITNNGSLSGHRCGRCRLGWSCKGTIAVESALQRAVRRRRLCGGL
jgi:hypothetical protein